MSHTYTRTAALLDEFAAAFKEADIVFLHKIYASARENYTGGVNGETLYEKVAANQDARYVHEVDDAFAPLREILTSGDIFVTLGAGNNWTLGEKLFSYFKECKNRETL